MSSKLAYLTVAPLIFALAACGGKSIAQGNGDNGGDATGGTGVGTGGTEVGTGGTAIETGGQGQAGSPSSGGAAGCAKYDDDSPAAVGVVLTNMTSLPISIGQQKVSCDVVPLFQVADATGSPLQDVGRCRTSCFGARTQGAGGCTAICLFPGTITLQPGETRSTSWDGLFGQIGELPASCLAYDPGMATIQCDQAKRIEPGSFTFSAQAGTTLDCSQTTGAGNCAACMADGNGGCATPGSLIGGKILTATTTVTLDQSYGIFPDSGSNPGASPSGGARALAVVNLVFTD